MGKPRLLSPGEAKRSFANRLTRVVDRARQVEVRFGLRPYVVYLVWVKWTGCERGEGEPSVVCRMPLLPVPEVEDLTGIARNPFAAGVYPVGSVRVKGISATYVREVLEGHMVPEPREIEVPEPYEFFWEIVEDGRHGPNPLRKRFRLASEPWLDAENQQWIVILEKQAGDLGRDGDPHPDPEQPKPDPWTTRRIEGPEED